MVELEKKKQEEIKQREVIYKERRDKLMRDTLDRDVEESQMSVMLMQSLEKKFERSDSILRSLIENKVKQLSEKNAVMMEKKYIVRERN